MSLVMQITAWVPPVVSSGPEPKALAVVNTTAAIDGSRMECRYVLLYA
jgi:hypothetical protein